MKIDINKLAEHFACTSFRVEGVYRCVRNPGEAGWQISSPFPGFIFPITGNAQFRFNDTLYYAKPGNIIHGGANMSLDKQVTGKTKWEHILVLYEIVASEPEDFSLSDTHFEIFAGESFRMNQLLQQLHNVSGQPGGIASFRIETLFRDILDEMFMCAGNKTSGKAQTLYEKAAAYIHEFYMEPITLSSLAEQNGVSHNRLVYVFRKYAGMGPGDYLLQYRLNRSRELLISSNAPLRELVQVVGFNDPFHFSKVFKKNFGISPSKFREKFTNNT